MPASKLLPAICFFLLAILAGCAAPAPAVDVSAIQTQAAQTVIAGLITPTPLAAPTLECDPRPFLFAASSSMEKFQDASERASATSRIALSPVVGEMQEVRREYKALVAPLCVQRLQVLVEKAMDAEIAGYLDFMAQRSDVVVQASLKVAELSWKDALNEYQEVGYLLGTPRPPTALPTTVPPTVNAIAYLQKIRELSAMYRQALPKMETYEEEYRANRARGKEMLWRERVSNLADELESAAQQVRALNVPVQMQSVHKEFMDLADKYRSAALKLRDFLALDNLAYLVEAREEAAFPNARLDLVLKKFEESN